MARNTAKSKKNMYSAAQIRRYFEIIQLSNRLDEVEQKLDEHEFYVYVDADKIKILIDESRISLANIKRDNPELYEQIMKSKDPDFLTGTGDCPC
ncbi:hypothetical protein [Methylobacterium isbiliense]|jgi:hypothetical protein|uniref:hypothetical protein n=1 Tax=Methylobacterium isbiliense TaxID=315478 RepID=UPI001EE2C8F1|nr:hypothetical protein [Methylobacterium isbiliense]MDN3626968.1 hypothetical protein [Methylobacterium isbiliense]